MSDGTDIEEMSKRLEDIEKNQNYILILLIVILFMLSCISGGLYLGVG